jgi:hypothetical protein
LRLHMQLLGSKWGTSGLHSNLDVSSLFVSPYLSTQKCDTAAKR